MMRAHGGTLDTVTAVELLDWHLGRVCKMEACAYALHLAELVKRLTQERQENRRVYELLAGSLTVVSDGVEPYAVARYFEMSLFSLLGYRIELYRCINCGRDLLAVPNALSARMGGFLCPACVQED